MKVGFVGLGKLGKPCSEVAVDKGHDVTGFDSANVRVRKIKVIPNMKEAMEDRDIVFVAVPTPHESEYGGEKPTSHLKSKDFDNSIVKDVLTELNEYMTKDQLIVLISTVLPCSNDKSLSSIVTNTNYVYSPFFIAQGTVAEDFMNPEMFLIGTDNNSNTKKLIEFYKTIADNPRIEVCSFKEAECIKVFYNTYITQKINFANMIQDVAEKIDTNSTYICDVLSKCTQRIVSPMYMKPGLGDGGSCHPRDNIALSFLAENLDLYDMFRETMRIREKQAETLAKAVLEQGSKVAFTSTGFKEGVDNTDGSYVLLVQHYIEENGGKIVDIEDCDILFKSWPADETPDNTSVFDVWKKYGKK